MLVTNHLGITAPLMCMKAFAGLMLALVMVQSAEGAPKGNNQDEVVATLKKAQGMIRQLAQEKSDLEGKLQAAEKELNEKRGQLDARTREAAHLQGELSSKLPVLSSLQSHNEKYRDQVGQMTGLLQKTQADNQLLVRMVEERSAWISKCESKNHDMQAMMSQILSEYQESDFLDKVKTLEPLTGIGSVEKENKAVDYQYKLSDLKVTKWGESAPTEPTN